MKLFYDYRKPWEKLKKKVERSTCFILCLLITVNNGMLLTNWFDG